MAAHPADQRRAAVRAARAAANAAELQATLVARHAEAHTLLAELAEHIDGIDPDTTDWGYAGNLARINDLLRQALGKEPQ